MAKGLRSSEKGSVAIMVAVMMTVLVMMAAVAIDIGRAVYARSQLQMEIDGAVKAAAGDNVLTLEGKVDSQRIADVANKYFKANHRDNGSLIDVASLKFTPQYRNDSTYPDAVVATLDAKVVMSFMKIWGTSYIPLHLEAAARRSHPPPLEMALVLDESQSMADTLPGGLTKSQAMFDALFDLVWQVLEPPYYGKVGIVPFAQQVNVRTTVFTKKKNANDPGTLIPQPWLDVPDSYVSNDTNCTVQGQTCTQQTSTCRKPDSTDKQPCTITVCTGGTNICTPTTMAFDGCVSPRLDSSGQPVADISNPTNPKYPGTLGTCRVSWVEDLLDRDAEENHDGANLLTHILVGIAPPWPPADPETDASFNTFIPIGLLWGWNMLDPAAPLTTASADTGPNRPNRAIVLVTDGDNNRWPTINGWNADPQAKTYADKLTKTVCDNIKTTTEIKIYVVAMTIPTSSTLDMLKDCASDPTMFFKADTAGQLKTAFTNIGRLVSSNSLIK